MIYFFWKGQFETLPLFPSFYLKEIQHKIDTLELSITKTKQAHESIKSVLKYKTFIIAIPYEKNYRLCKKLTT